MNDTIQTYIRPGVRAHLVGIGGVSMAPLAEVLHGRGVIVTGSDMHESAAVAASALPGDSRNHRPPAPERRGGGLRHPHRRRPRRQPGNRRRPGRRYPRL